MPARSSATLGSRSSLLRGLLLVIELRQVAKHFHKKSKAFVFVLCNFTHKPEVCWVIQRHIALPRTDRDKEMRGQLMVVGMLEPDTVTTTMPVSTLDGVVKLLEAGL